MRRFLWDEVQDLDAIVIYNKKKEWISKTKKNLQSFTAPYHDVLKKSHKANASQLESANILSQSLQDLSNDTNLLVNVACIKLISFYSRQMIHIARVVLGASRYRSNQNYTVSTHTLLLMSIPLSQIVQQRKMFSHAHWWFVISLLS